MKRKRKTPLASSAAAAAADVADDAEPAPIKTAKKKKKRAAPAAPVAAGGEKKRVRPKAAKEPEDDDDEDDDDDEEDDEEEEQADGGNADDDLDVEFEFVDPDEEDFHTVSSLLKAGMWDFVEPNFSELADSIVGQGNIGTLVKSSADVSETTMCGMLTALNLRQFEQLSWPREITDALVAKAKKFADPSVASRFEAIMKRTDPKAKEVGFIFNERYVNLPPQLIPPLHEALRDDIAWSCTTPECPPEERPFYAFDHFVGITRCMHVAGGDTQPAPQDGKKKKKKLQAANGGSASATGMVYPQAEYEIYMKRALLSFTFPFTSEKRQQGVGAKPRGQERRAVFVMTKKGLEEVVADLKKNFVESQGLSS